MPPLTDPDILARYRSALANWYVTGYVTWKDPASEWVERNLDGCTLVRIAELMYEQVLHGGVISQVPERRPEWNDYDFHYDLRLRIDGRLIYLETILIDIDPDDPVIRVVSIHDA